MTNPARPFNAVNRGVYIADNLPFLRSLNTESVDLVCIDPPFAKNETFGKKNDQARDPLKPPLTHAERETELRLLASWGIRNEKDADKSGINWPETHYKDFWSWEADIHEGWLKDLEEFHKPIANLIEVTRDIHSDSAAAYLCYMAVRMLEIRRILKPEGSLYLHCDHTVGAYLRGLLDAVFGNGTDGKPGFRSEIVWRSATAHSDSKRYGANTETIFFYTKGEEWVWNTIYETYDAKHKARFRFKDPDGRLWQDDNLTAKGLLGGGYEYEYKGVTSLWRVPLATMQQLDAENRLHFTNKGGIRRKRYMDEAQGRPVQQLWDDINPLNSQARERAGYPTQKPVALAERIISVSSNPGDVVLDCFAGCAYVAVAAERLERQWIACDINPRAWTVFKRQFNKPNLALLTCHDTTTGQQVLGGNPTVTIHGPAQLPERTSPVTETQIRDLKLPERKFKIPASIIPEPEMLEKLLVLSGYMAWCCGFANRRPNGGIVKTVRNFHLDHIAPKSIDNTGTSNEIQNRAPLCPYHNIRKSNRRIGLAEYRREIADAGEMLVDSINDLINLDYALAQANLIYGQAYAQKHPLPTP